jgi:GT2 family glycosyltransferase
MSDSLPTLSCSVIIVSYNSGDYIPACLNSVQEALKGIDSEIIVLDNGSPEPLTDEHKKAFPAVLWLNSEKNLGFGRGCNMAAKKATKQILFFINPDTVVAESIFRKTLEYMSSKPDAGIVGCKILNGDGSLQWACRRTFPSPLAAVFKTVGLAALFPKNRFFASYNMTYLDPDIETKVDAVSGSFFGVRRDIYQQVNGFDEDYFMYGEDLDICLRIKKLGYNNYYFPGTSILHFKGQSSRTRRVRSYIDFYKAMLIFANKHHNYHLPIFVVAIGIFCASLVGIFSRLVPQWWKMILDVGVVLLSGYATSAIFGTSTPSQFIIALSFAVWLPLAILGEYATSSLQGSRIISVLLPFTTLACGLSFWKWGAAPSCFLSMGFVLFGLLFWRRLIFWGYYFYTIFAKKRYRSILLGGTSDSLANWFDRYRVVPGMELLGCVSNSPEKVTRENREHLLGSLSDMPSICRRTGCRELLVFSDMCGYHEPFDKEWLRSLNLKALLLVGSAKKGDFSVVDLNYLY